MDENNVEFRPELISYFQLNENGSYEDASPMVASVYIDESQVGKLWDKDTARHIRQTYGPYVGIVHSRPVHIRQFRGSPRMSILGGCAK